MALSKLYITFRTIPPGRCSLMFARIYVQIADGRDLTNRLEYVTESIKIELIARESVI